MTDQQRDGLPPFGQFREDYEDTEAENEALAALAAEEEEEMT